MHLEADEIKAVARAVQDLLDGKPEPSLVAALFAALPPAAIADMQADKVVAWKNQNRDRMALAVVGDLVVYATAKAGTQEGGAILRRKSGITQVAAGGFKPTPTAYTALENMGIGRWGIHFADGSKIEVGDTDVLSFDATERLEVIMRSLLEA